MFSAMNIKKIKSKVVSLSRSQCWRARSLAGDGEPSHLKAAHFNDVGNS